MIGFLSMSVHLSYWSWMMIDDGGIIMANDYFVWQIKCKNICYVPSTMEVRKTKAWPKFTEKSGKYWRQSDVCTNIGKNKWQTYQIPSIQKQLPTSWSTWWQNIYLRTLQTPNSFILTMKTNAICKECICKSFINNLPPSAKTLEDFSGRNWKWSKFRRNQSI